MYCIIFQETDELDQEVERATKGHGEEDAETGEVQQSRLQSGKSTAHYHLIHPNDVLKALVAYVQDHKEQPKYVFL